MKRLCATSAVLALVASWGACAGGDDPGTGASTAGSSSGSWDGCNDPGEPCRTAADCCLLWDRRCGDPVCDQGVCAIGRVEEFRSQARGDCVHMQCDESGYPQAVPAPDDIDGNGTPCTEDFCIGDRSELRYVPKGPAPDGSGFCDGDGRLVECVATPDCNDPSLLCSDRFKCVPLHCENHERDPSLGETGSDCGGPCNGCQLDVACDIDEDCLSRSCGPSGTCIRASCHDGQKNGQEADVDCGFYACDVRCPEGGRCMEDIDCTTVSCFGGRCQPPTCEDASRNGDEEEIDCGGPDCPPCGSAWRADSP